MPKPHRMKAYATFDLWKADQRLKHYALIRALRTLADIDGPRFARWIKQAAKNERED